MKKLLKRENGITLIALVITIIVLLILTGVTINAVIGENGIANKAKDAKLETRAGEVQEVIDIWKTENYAASNDIEWEDILTEEELLAQLIESGKVEESEINRETKTITIGSKQIDYALKKSGVFGILYGYGELLPYNPAPSSYSYDLESEYSDLVYLINEDENISKLNAEYYYEYYELCFNTTGKVEETEDRVYVQTINYEDNYVQNGKSVLLERINIITFEEKVQPEHISFSGVRDVVFNNFEYLDTSRITDMSRMFSQCNTNNLDLSGFDTSKVTDMSEMFYYAKIDDLDVTGFDTSNVTNMNKMFRGFRGFSNIDLSMWNMGNVINTDEMFIYCDTLESIILPDSLTKIGACCFDCCELLENVILPDSLTEIGDLAFGSCALKEIIIPNSVTRIGYSAFYGCVELTDVNISLNSKLIIIDDRAFYNCNNLVNITLPDTLETIGKMAFYSCDSLIDLFIPASVEHVGEDAFVDVSGPIRCGASSQPSDWSRFWKETYVSAFWGEKR